MARAIGPVKVRTGSRCRVLTEHPLGGVRPVLSTTATTFVQAGQPFTDQLVFSTAAADGINNPWFRSATTGNYAPVKATGVVYGPFQSQPAESDTVPAGAPVAGEATITTSLTDGPTARTPRTRTPRRRRAASTRGCGRSAPPIRARARSASSPRLLVAGPLRSGRGVVGGADEHHGRHPGEDGRGAAQWCRAGHGHDQLGRLLAAGERGERPGEGHLEGVSRHERGKPARVPATAIPSTATLLGTYSTQVTKRRQHHHARLSR